MSSRTKTRPGSTAANLFVDFLRIADIFANQAEQVVKTAGLTGAQYNVLRILRGTGETGLPTLAIRDRMVEEAAGITRLLDKLESAGFVVRERSTPDRRQVLCHITPKGLSMIAALDKPMDAANLRSGSMLDDAERQKVVELLGAVRSACSGRVPERGQGSTRAGHPPR